ncbi:aminotransferase class V-fold PLP-dependent enzyme [Nocardia aurantia]|uniref:Cysteine desulfurase SufS n=1 Tax=Nocardia aurantia TaxID=2585199 RepID=A0A7K0E035_9NOCA|nr:aminotransferase class V-fold PLP-dependent enzyme [Nocardia aurantia]MQY30464.1 Cysteine desulfurase SufS [Nocardia aurantia]
MRSPAPCPPSARPSAAVDRSAVVRPAALRALFPALAEAAEVYLDSASTTQKPLPVLAAIDRYHRSRTANAGRGTYPWATGWTRELRRVRERTAAFLGADADEIVFTPGATAGLNAVALSWGLAALQDGDEILYSPRDHASAVYPWQQLQATLARFGRRLRLVPYRVTAHGEADTADILAKVTGRTRLIAVSHLHHVFGALTTLEELRGRLDPGILLCFDCSQSGGHIPLDVGELGADFAVLSAHKMFGATGTGVLYCRRRVHEQLTAFLPGGNSGVTGSDSGLLPAAMPERMEGGTPNIAGILALGAALEVLDDIGRAAVAEHNRVLTRQLIEGLRPLPGLELLPGPAHARCEAGYGIVSFTLAGIGATDLGFVLAELGFLVRTGAHCVPAHAGADDDSVRVSTHVYTSADDIDRFVRCVATLAAELAMTREVR